MNEAAYDRIGRGYSNVRRPDPRIAARIDAALGDARTVLNVGAGAGSYEPPDREVTAVEPSAEMIAQRPPGSAPVVQANAEDLPFADDSFDAAMAVLTVHHWADREAGLGEMARIARRRLVLVAFDPEALEQPLDRRRLLPGDLEAEALLRGRQHGPGENPGDDDGLPSAGPAGLRGPLLRGALGTARDAL